MAMTLDDLQTPCLVLDLGILKRNLAHMQGAIARHPGVVLRPHMKTAKSIEVARLAAPGFGPITVSTLAEAQYFADAGWRDQIYAVGITPQKLDRAAALGCKVITDDLEAAAAIAAHPGPIRALVEIDVGEGRGGVAHLAWTVRRHRAGGKVAANAVGRIGQPTEGPGNPTHHQCGGQGYAQCHGHHRAERAKVGRPR